METKKSILTSFFLVPVLVSSLAIPTLVQAGRGHHGHGHHHRHHQHHHGGHHHHGHYINGGYNYIYGQPRVYYRSYYPQPRYNYNYYSAPAYGYGLSPQMMMGIGTGHAGIVIGF